MDRRLFAAPVPYCVLVIIVSCLFACGRGNESSDLSDSHDEDSSLLIGPSEEGVPDLPRRRLVQEFDWYKKKNVLVGLETSFAGSTFAVQTEVEFAQSYSVMVWLFVPGDGNAMIDNGGVFLNNGPGREFVYVCRYMGYYEATPKVRGKISVFGSGVSRENALRERTAIVQTSNSFTAATGSTWETVYKHCLAYGEEKNYRESIDQDLRAMTKGMIYHDDQSECLQANHCESWHNALLPGVRAGTAPACVARENGARFCALRANKGSACSLFDKDGTRLTPGLFEYPCRSGTSCVATQQGGWFKGWSVYSPWKAECR